jgi:CDP-diacylglycerol--glycerol-3-phosphate 3-phosphatidyltransferase
MTLADKITLSRLVVAPFFFVIYLFPILAPFWFDGKPPWTIPVLWALFIIAELTDMIDGHVARKRKEVSDFGKFFDPFADTLVQLTFFLCFVIDGILPVVLYLVVLYREFSVLFIRNLMLKKGIVMGARMGGKIKTVAYILAGAVSLMASSVRRLGLPPSLFEILRMTGIVIFALSVLMAVLSFADYVFMYRRSGKEEGKQ